jgi:glycyl-tRNA synthetase beta chain
MSATLLLEIGCEELPTSFLDGALEQLRSLVPDELAKARVAHGAVRVLGTARRLVALVADVADAVSAREEELLGPSESAAKAPNGAWTKAAEGFAKKNNLPLDRLEIADTPKGRYLRAVIRHEGAASASLLPGVLGAVARRITFAKSMRWASGDVAFGRPVQWIVALLGDAVVPFEFAGVAAGRTTRGHRFLAPAPVAVDHADAYVSVIGERHVRVDPDARRVAMLAALESAAAAEGGELVRDAFLEGEVLGLVEEPHVVVGRFEERYLALPDALIESVMRGHQRYFAVERRRPELGPTGGGIGEGAKTPPAHANRLLPLFLTVVNTARDVETVRRGNERVMRARLSDAAFFVAQDRQSRLDARVPALDAVTFHAKLGSYGDKARRVASLARWLAEKVGADGDEAARAGTLAKADLVTLTVGEFPELQGLMGAFYAMHDGEAPAVARAVAEHYQPKGAADAVAPSKLGAVLAVADRLDTLVGCFAVGLRPSGSEDPFGLRRTTLGLLRTLLHHGARVSLAEAVGRAWDVYAEEGGKMAASAAAARVTREGAAADVLAFVADRLKGLLEERHGRDVVAACMAAGRDVPVDVQERVEALAAFWQTPAAADLAVAFRRVFNISREAPAGELTDADRALLTHPAEVALLAAFDGAREKLGPLFAARQFGPALELVASTLRAPVDRLFNEVMVMDKDESLRAARLRLMGRIADSLGGFARFDYVD